MLKGFIIIKQITLFILPYIILYSLYIQINGEISPGGGFQAGVILASVILGLDLIWGKKIFQRYLSINLLVFIATLGVIIYGAIGLVPLLSNANYLDYSLLAQNKLFAQSIGIFIIELGVGLTVSATMCLIYFVITYGGMAVNARE